MAIPPIKDCNPGVTAIGFNAIVAIEQTEERTKGGIILPDAERDRKDVVAMRGRLVSLGTAAFDYARFDEPPLREGDAVMIANLAGKRFAGTDDKHYRIMTDRDLIGHIAEEAA